MKRPGRHLSRPLYESLPWFYLLGGFLTLAASYRHEGRGWISLSLGLLGFLAVLGGVVVLLRRRDFRDMRSHYLEQDTPLQTPPRDD
jgi:hypothetical protein